MTSAVPTPSYDSNGAAPSPERVKLLLVDDDRDNLLALEAILDPLSEELMLAECGLDALRLCLDNDFAAILLDVRMPEMDGFETAELIRARRRSRQTPILFLTAYRSDEQLFRGYDLGAVDFLFKPIVPEILQSKVAVFVELSRSEQLSRRQAEALARTEQKFRAVLEAAPDAMVITAEDGSIQLANSRTDSLFGYPREQLIGFNIRGLIPQWECPSLPVDDAASPPQAEHMEKRLSAVCKNGSSFPADITLSPFASAEGLLVTTAIRDATEQVRSEERIRRINVELEKRVAERTSDLTRSNEALRQFAWAASHDLQEPIRMVLSYSQWIAKTAAARLDASETDMLQFVQDSAARMGGLLAALRQYIYISESGNQEITKVDCNAVARTAISNLEGAITEAGACVECNSLPTLDSIEVLLLQLFQNLIGNAIKYRSSEAPRICINASLRDDLWTFSVMDNGIGIEPQHLEYIFGVFKRLHGKKYSGTGIGLAICKAAMDRLGGRIWAESELGSGSIFHFELPRQEAGITMAPHHILLVEDNPGDVRLIEESLRTHSLDYRLSHYETADAAIFALSRCGTNGDGVPELILLDFNVPRGDARDILAAASKNPALAGIPKVVVTSYLAPGDRAQALELGATGFIDKPPNLDSFLSEVGGAIADLLRRD